VWKKKKVIFKHTEKLLSSLTISLTSVTKWKSSWKS